jgi:hypothetical protein
MKHEFTWRGEDCLMVAAIVSGRCTGCLFRNTLDDECPHTDEGANATCETQHNIIFIRNTPKAITAYALRRLEGT